MSEQDQLPEQDEADLPQLQQCNWMPEPGAKPIDGDWRVQVALSEIHCHFRCSHQETSVSRGPWHANPR